MASKRKCVRVGDPGYNETISKWLNEIGSDFSDVSTGSDEYLPGSEHNSGSEISCDEFENTSVNNRDECTLQDCQEKNSEDIDQQCSQHSGQVSEHSKVKSYYGKNRYKWCCEPATKNVRTPKHNIISHLPGLKGPAKSLHDTAAPLDVWKCIFTQDMADEVILHTNIKLRTLKAKYSRENKPELKDLDCVEFDALLGVLYYWSVFKSNHEDLESLFATDGTGREIFRCIMSVKRLLILLACLRFDNPEDREQRKEKDPAAAISWIFNELVKNSQLSYSLGELTCIDEMLVGFRGRCKFRIYMPNKPSKYGIKVMILSDARTSYFYNAYVYTGKDCDGKLLPQEDKKFLKPTQAVLQLAQPIVHSNRNITADNWFSSIEVAEELRNRGLTYVGTLKKNKKEIPATFLPNRSRQEGSSIYGFTKDITLLSHVPKKGKAVLLISTMHHAESTDIETGKPEIIALYNDTKSGVDTLDKKCANYSTNRRTNRWPLALFYAILNIAGVNSFVLHGCYAKNVEIPRSTFLKELAKELVQKHMERRMTNDRLPRELRLSIARILKKEIEPVSPEKNAGKRRRCGLCPRSRDKKTKNMCDICEKPMCDDCRANICKYCHTE